MAVDGRNVDLKEAVPAWWAEIEAKRRAPHPPIPGSSDTTPSSLTSHTSIPAFVSGPATLGARLL